ncbi:MAG TPA: sulfite exporter TauE/SafE family protein, partial [Chitinophagaceae bacterium]|nr:sulfite exporter TauE/SafE family protein [Chitinophagaceae bacterium]
FKWKIFLPFAVASVPMAFFGGKITLEAIIYKKILGLVLLIPVVRFLFFANIPDSELKKSNIPLSLLIGAAIGFLSGAIGIGGGIILSPVLLLLKWTNQKQTAAISALFIFVNSIAGLIAQLNKGVKFSTDMVTYVAIAFIAGIFGAYFGSLKFKQTILKNVLGIVLLLAAYKLIFSKS